MQADGNLVMYMASGAVPFATGEVGSGSSDYLSMQDDGNVVQYGNGGAVFTTKSDTNGPSSGSTTTWVPPRMRQHHGLKAMPIPMRL